MKGAKNSQHHVLVKVANLRRVLQQGTFPDIDAPVHYNMKFGQLGGAQAVKFVGNQSHLSKAVLLRTGMSLLSF